MVRSACVTRAEPWGNRKKPEPRIESCDGRQPMLDNRRDEQRTWWKRVVTGILAIAFGLCAVAFPAGMMFGRILDVIFGQAKRYSGSMTAVAALLALVAWVAIDGLVHLFGTGAQNNRTARLRGAAGVAIAIA